MKKILLTVFTAIFAFAAATAQLTGIVVESASDGSIGNCVNGTQPAGTTTYRIYAELQDPTDFLTAVGANEGAVDGVPFQCHPLDISTTTNFYNNPAGAALGDNINAAVLCTFLPDMGYDTWVTIGNEDNTGTGTNSNWTNPTDPIAPACSAIPGANLTAEDGAWFALPGNPNGFPVGPNNRVLLGQFTTDGEFSFNLNIAVLDEGVGGTNLYYPWNNDAGCVNLLNYQDVTGLGLTFPVAAVPGCTDDTACNYDAAATEDNGSCTFAEPGLDCAGNCLVGVPLVIDIVADEYPGENSWTLTADGVEIAFGDGTTQTASICADPAVCYVFTMFDSFGDGQFGSDFGGVDGTTTITLDGVEIFFSTGDWGDEISASTGPCPILGCIDATACNFDAAADTDDGSCEFLSCAGCTDSGAINFDGTATIDDGSCILPGCVDAPVNITYCYVDNETTSLTYTEITPGTGVVIAFNAGNMESCCDDMTVYDGADNTAASLGTFTGDLSGLVFQSSGASLTIELSSDGSWSCDIPIGFSPVTWDYDVYCGTIFGCTDDTAVNYNPDALTDDLSCDFGTPGCTDVAACNYDAAATFDDGSCTFPPANQDCFGNCISGLPLVIDIVADEYPGENAWTLSEEGVGVIASGDGNTQNVTVCVDPANCYEFVMTDSFGDGQFGSNFGGVDGTTTITLDGVEVFFSTSNWGGAISGFIGTCAVPGCTDINAFNYDDQATEDDGSCILPGCGDAPVALSYCYANSEATSLVFTEATPGSGVVIAFNSGDFESCCDNVTVYDGPDNLSPSLGTFTGDVSGLFFQSSGASLTLEINSDSSVACATGSFGTSALNYDVYCADIVLGCTDVTACNYNAAAVADDGSCDFSCYGCTDVAAVNYDPAATIDDGSCVFSTLNDVPALATPIALDTFNGPGAGCNGITGEDISAATVVAPEGNYRQTNPDLWYSFVPLTPGNSIRVTTSDFDALIEVFDAGFNLVTEAQGATFEDDNFDTGSEVFNTTDLVAGDVYYIRVAPYFEVGGPAIFDICVQRMRDSACDYGVGPYSLCGTFKADFVFADAYIFNFTSQTTGLTYTSNTQASTFLTLSNVPGLLNGDMYDVEIQTLYNVVDGGGNDEEVIVSSDAPCEIDINETPLISLRASDNSVNFGPQFPQAYIRANTFVCGAIAYTWKFTRTDIPLLATEFTSSSSSTVVRISDALGLAVANEGGVYNVEVKPVLANGSATLYGPVEEITILGAAGVQGDVIVANNNMSEDSQRADELVVSPSAMIYPNPSTGDAITLNLNDVAADVEVAVITVTDFVGRTVASQQITISGAQHQEVLNLNNLASGTYLINVNMNGKVLTEKLIIAK